MSLPSTLRATGLVALLAACGAEVPDAADETDGPDLPGTEACEPGMVPAAGVHQLTPVELDRAVWELTGTWLDVGGLVPNESAGAFAGSNASQSITLAHVEGWAAVAQRVADALVDPEGPARQIEAEAIGWPGATPFASASDAGSWVLVESTDEANATLRLPVTLPVPQRGRYRISVRAMWMLGWVDLPEGQDVQVSWDLGGGESSDVVPLSARFDTPEVLEFELEVPFAHAVAQLTFAVPSVPTAIAIDHLRIEGPLGPEVTRPTCTAEAQGAAACGRSWLTPLATRAWRRTPNTEEIEALLGLIERAMDEGHPFETGLHVAIQAILRSPSFLLRVPDTADMAPGTRRPATPTELAERLAALLWSSPPDEALAACAAAGTLSAGASADDPCGLTAQVDRMLADDRADAVVQDFVPQWLGLSTLDRLADAPDQRPDVSPDLLRAMKAETLAVLDDLRMRQLDIADLLVSGRTYTNGPLADHYGLDGSFRSALRPVTQSPDRAGLLGHASVLTATSNADRTSPVKRGAYVLSRLLCDPPKPPPPKIPALDDAAADGGSVRDILAAHRQNPSCAACHDDIDPLGLPLEGFDRAGRQRNAYGDGTPVRTDATLLDGTGLADPADLAAHIAADPRFRPCVVRQLVTWALERAPSGADQCVVEAALAGDEQGRVTLEHILRTVALSESVTTVTAGEVP